MTDVVSFFFVAQTATVVVTSLILVYPVVAYARNVAYTRGLVLLSAAFFVVTATYVTTFFFDAAVASGALDLLGAVLAALGTWQFARPFVRIDDEVDARSAPTESTATGGAADDTADGAAGGFEGAGDD